MNNKIETLRALWFTKDESPEIAGFDFTDKEKKLVEEFKKIYELGTPQLEKFIDLLDESDDTYNILYFKSVLRNGPFKDQTEDLIKKSKKLIDVSDNMGNVGIPIFSPQNIVIFEGTEAPDLPKTITSKLPKFMADTIKDSMKIVEDVFRKGMTTSSSIEDTPPIQDKKNQERYGSEPSGSWATKPNANFMVKDSYFNIQVITPITEDIKKIVKDYLESKNPQQNEPTRYDMLMEIKEYNPFDKSKNKSKAANPKDNKVTEIVDGEKITLDLLGEAMLTVDQLTKTISIDNPESTSYMSPNTNKGQLGD